MSLESPLIPIRTYGKFISQAGFTSISLEMPSVPLTAVLLVAVLNHSAAGATIPGGSGERCELTQCLLLFRPHHERPQLPPVFVPALQQSIGGHRQHRGHLLWLCWQTQVRSLIWEYYTSLQYWNIFSQIWKEIWCRASEGSPPPDHPVPVPGPGRHWDWGLRVVKKTLL